MQLSELGEGTALILALAAIGGDEEAKAKIGSLIATYDETELT